MNLFVSMSKIYIDSPCSENWENMSVEKTGRFCASCSKSVYDVRDWSDDSIQKAYIKNGGSLCIRIPAARLANKPRQRTRPVFSLLLAVVLTFWLSVKSTLSKSQSLDSHRDSKSKTDPHEYVKEMSIRGHVMDTVKTAMSLPGAFIKLKRNDELVFEGISDMDGYFRIVLQDLSKEKDTLTISVEFMGYETMNDTIELKEKLDYDVYMAESHVCLNEAVVVRSKTEIIQGGIMMGIMSRNGKRSILQLDQYDTKTYHHDDLERYNFGRD